MDVLVLELLATFLPHPKKILPLLATSLDLHNWFWGYRINMVWNWGRRGRLLSQNTEAIARFLRERRSIRGSESEDVPGAGAGESSASHAHYQNRLL